jgi:hypothetical protein
MTASKHNAVLDRIDLFKAINDAIDTMSGDALLKDVRIGVEAFLDSRYRPADIPGVYPETVVDAVVPAVAQMMIDQALWYRKQRRQS